MVSRHQVISAYQLLLEREPESDTVIAEKLHCSSVRALVNAFLDSQEFQDKHPDSPKTTRRWVLAEHDLGFRIWLNLADTGVSWPILHGGYETAETAFMARSLKAGDRVLDIGANLGFFSLLAALRVGPSGRVDGFEPLPFLHEAAVRSVAENGFAHCEIHKTALADGRGEARLVYAPGSPNWGGAFLSFDGESLPDHACESVPIAVLTDFTAHEPVDFIKIDVEGAEHRILSACGDYLRDCRPVILSELHQEQLQRVSGVSTAHFVRTMTGLGYACRLLTPEGTTGESFTGENFSGLTNVVFLPEN